MFYRRLAESLKDPEFADGYAEAELELPAYLHNDTCISAWRYDGGNWDIQGRCKSCGYWPFEAQNAT